MFPPSSDPITLAPLNPTSNPSLQSLLSLSRRNYPLLFIAFLNIREGIHDSSSASFYRFYRFVFISLSIVLTDDPPYPIFAIPVTHFTPQEALSLLPFTTTLYHISSVFYIPHTSFSSLLLTSTLTSSSLPTFIVHPILTPYYPNRINSSPHSTTILASHPFHP